MDQNLAVIPAHVPEDRVLRFDFRNDEKLRSDPWAYIAGLDDRPDIFFSPDLGGYWIVTRIDMIDEVFSDHEQFTATSVSIPKRDTSFVLIPNNLDPPQHSGYRKTMANNLFSPKALGSLMTDTRTYTRRLFDSFTPGRCDFITEFAYPLPIDTFLNLMGADFSQRDLYLHWIKMIFRGDRVEDRNRGYAEAFAGIKAWLTQQLEDVSKNQGTMFQALVDSRVDGRPLTFDEMLSMTVMLFTGGLDTITSQMSHIMRFFAENPGHRQHLVDHPEDIPFALEEMLRRFGISFIGRAVAKDLCFHGVTMKKGDAICAGTPIAGLDPRAYPDPLRVDFGRGEGRRVKHLGFGAGRHLCVGAHLARVQLTVMIEELLPRMPNMRIMPDSKIENIIGSTMMLKSLPLEWDI